MNKEIESIINRYINNDVARDKVINYIEELEEYITYWQKETDKRQDKIDKAIELIEDYKFRGFKVSIEQLLEILKDSDTDE